MATAIIRTAVEAKAKILVPVFAIGRTQLLLYLLAGRLPAQDAAAVPRVHRQPDGRRGYPDLRAEHRDLRCGGAGHAGLGRAAAGAADHDPCASAAESRALNTVAGPCMIMAGSGMCSGGRISHHLRHNLDRPETAVLIVGYQSPGSLGRRLVDGEKRVTIFGETVMVRASIHTLGGFSAHAGQDELVQWFASMAPARPELILAHGEDRARQALARRIASEHGIRARCPALGETIEV